MADADRAVALDGKLMAAYFCRGLVHKLSQDCDKATADLDRVLELSPGHQVARQMLDEISRSRVQSPR